MEQKNSNNSLDLETLWEFCRREGEAVIYRRGDQLECEGNPAQLGGVRGAGLLQVHSV